MTKANEQKLVMDLFALGMTALHRVGLAGLWMTLKKFERGGVKLPDGSWKLTKRSVTLEWKDNPKQFFEALFKESFKIDGNGLIWFPALGEPMDNPQAAVVLNGAILNTFLQHGRTRKADPSRSPGGAVSVQIDQTTLPLQYRRFREYAHQKAADKLLTPGGKLRVTQLAGWHFPGGAVRHTRSGWGKTALEEPPERLVPLLYAPVGVIYFRIRRRGERVRPLYALVIPEVEDLKQYEKTRAAFLQQGVADLLASGTGEAGLRVLATLHARGMLRRIGVPACRVVSFGVVPWSTQQKTRVELFTVHARTQEHLGLFNLCRQVLAPRLVALEGREPFWDVPQSPDIIARNLAEGRDWYEGFADFVSDIDVRNHVFRFERGGLSKMVKEAGFDEDRERIFIHACHEALRRHMGRKFARPGGADWGKEMEKIRVAFARCKNAATLRAEVADFWSRGGPLHVGKRSLLKANAGWWQEVLPLLAERNWRKAKDLALLALASYQPASKEEEEVLSAETTSETA